MPIANIHRIQQSTFRKPSHFLVGKEPETQLLKGT